MATVSNDNNDIQLLADGCTALLQSVFGDNNWYRWNEIKQQTQHDSLQTFITWMLDVAEQEINRPDGVEDREADRSGETPWYTAELAEQPVMAAGPGSEGDPSIKQELLHVDGAAASRGEEVGSGYQRGEWEVDAEGTLADWNAAGHSGIDAEGTNGRHVVDFDSATRQQSSSSQHPPTSTTTAAAYHTGDSDTAAAGTAVQIMRMERAFFCKHCGVSLSDIDVVREHIALRHEGEGAIICCSCCSQMFSAVEHYVDYHRVAHNTQLPESRKRARFVCDYCAKGFIARKLLEDHIANKHLKLGPRYSCPNCLKKFSHFYDCNRHKKSCQGNPAPLQ